MKNQSVSCSLTVTDSGVAIVRIAGQVIINILDTLIVNRVSEFVEKTPRPKVVMNLGEVGYLDSYSFASIIKVRGQVRENDGELALCNPNEDILYLFELTNFLKAVPVYRTEDEAIKAVLSGDHTGRVVDY